MANPSENPETTNRDMLSKVYAKLAQSLKNKNPDAQDALQSTAEHLLKRGCGYDDTGAWEWRSERNLGVYLKGAIKRRLVQVQQDSHADVMLSLEALIDRSADLDKEIGPYDATDHDDMISARDTLDSIMYHLTDSQKVLFWERKVLGKTIREIARAAGRRWQSIVRDCKQLDVQLTKLPLVDICYSPMVVAAASHWNKATNNRSTDIVTPIGLLKRARRERRLETKKTLIDKYRAKSQSARIRHAKRLTGRNKDVCASALPVNVPHALDRYPDVA